MYAEAHRHCADSHERFNGRCGLARLIYAGIICGVESCGFQVRSDTAFIFDACTLCLRGLEVSRYTGGFEFAAVLVSGRVL